MSKKSIGIIGCGAVTQSFYAETMREHDAYEVTMVADLDQDRANTAAGIFGARIETADTIAKTADGIIIATPPSTHAALIRRCAAPGRTIFCEKPFTTSEQTARELVSEATDTVLCVGHFRRLYPQVGLARKLVETGLLGEVRAISASEGGRFTWEAQSDYTTRDPAGGVLWDTGSHTLDMALFAAGLDTWDDFEMEDVEVIRDQPEPSHDLSARATLVGTRSVELRLHVSRRRALPNVVRIVGTRASLSMVVGLESRVVLSSDSGSVAVQSTHSYEQPLECFDLQLQEVFARERPGLFAADRFLTQIRILERFSLA